MRRRVRCTVLALLLAWSTGTHARQDSFEPTAALLERLKTALETAAVSTFLSVDAPDLAEVERRWLLELVGDGGPSAVRIEPRFRLGDTFTAEVLIERGGRATLADWQLTVAPSRQGRLTLTSVSETSRLDGLVKLELDTSRQFNVRDLVVEGPDFRLSIPSGTAFAATVDGVITAMVLQGRSTIRFTPVDPTEQGQLRIFAGSPSLDVTANDVFVRVSPSDAAAILQGTVREQARVDAGALARMRRLFDERAASHDIGLGNMSTARWTLNLRPGNLFVEFRTRRDGWLTYSRALESEQDVSLVDRANRRQISLYTSGSPGGGPSLTVTSNAAYRTTHTDLDVVFDPERTWLRGHASLLLAFEAPTRGLVLRLAESLRVLSVSSPELGPLLFVRSEAEGRLLVGLPRAIGPTERLTLDLRFQGALEPQRLDDDRPESRLRPDALDALRVPPRYLYSNAAPWYPQVPMNPHATATLRITVPSSFDVVATGQRGEPVFSAFADDPAGAGAREARTVTFRAPAPIRYLAFVTTARLEPAARQPADRELPVDVDVLTVPGSVAARQLAASRVHEILSFYTSVLGAAPYRSLTIAALDDQIPSGHSPAHFALINYASPITPYTWDRDPVAFDDVPDFFLAHEIAHQWWGQAVAGRDYQDSWISEGFAQYLAWMYVTSIQGPVVGEGLMARMRMSTEGLEAEGPIRLGFRLGHLRNDRRVYRAIVYNKSAVVLHMLRRLIGDEAFRAGLRHIVTTHRFTSIGTAEIQQAFQARTDLPLERFFARWVRGAGTPQLYFTWSADGTGTLSIDVEQRGSVFDLAYAANVHYADGSRQRVPLVITAATERFVVPTTGIIRRVEFNDPLTPARVVVR